MNSTLEERKKMFGLFANGQIDEDVARGLENEMNLGLDTDSEEESVEEEPEAEVASPMKDTPEKTAKDREVEARLDETLMRKPKPRKSIATKKKVGKMQRPPSGRMLNKLKEEEKRGSQ